VGEPAEVIDSLRAEPTESSGDFDGRFAEFFEAHFPRLFRYLDRLGGDPDAAADLAQEAFIRLYRRGSFPDSPEAWLITVAMNLFRNRQASASRRRRLLTLVRGAHAHSDAPADPAMNVESAEAVRRVRRALDRLGARDRELLLLRAEGYAYRELAEVFGVAEGSVGTLLARAKDAFARELGDAG
jgi:RNA polymerase sigma-70 factor (ECF subfamily)